MLVADTYTQLVRLCVCVCANQVAPPPTHDRLGHLECLKALAAAGANMNTLTASGGFTPLHAASANAHTHIVE